MQDPEEDRKRGHSGQIGGEKEGGHREAGEQEESHLREND